MPVVLVTPEVFIFLPFCLFPFPLPKVDEELKQQLASLPTKETARYVNVA